MTNEEAKSKHATEEKEAEEREKQIEETLKAGGGEKSEAQETDAKGEEKKQESGILDVDELILLAEDALNKAIHV